MFEGIKARIKDKAPDVKTIRVYNNQDVFSEDARTIAYPAVFVGWESFELESRGQYCKYGYGNVVIRVVTQFLSENPFVAYDMETQVMIALEGYNNWSGSRMECIETETDESSDSLYVSKLYFDTDYYEDITPDWVVCDEIEGIKERIDLVMDGNGDGVYTNWDEEKFIELINEHNQIIITGNDEDIILIV